DFHARHCTFSIAGNHPSGVIIARLQGAGPATTASLGAALDVGTGEAKARFSHCLVRGQDAVLVATHNIPAEILIEHTLAGGAATCANLNAWRTMWGHREGDQVLADAWPPRPLGALEELPALSWHPAETPAALAATGGPGPVGCDVGLLPAEPPLWKQRTYE